MLDLFRFDGRVAVVTGATRWLGRDIADALAQAGCDVVVASRDLDWAEEFAAGIAATSGVDATGFANDVRSFDQVTGVPVHELLGVADPPPLRLHGSGGDGLDPTPRARTSRRAHGSASACGRPARGSATCARPSGASTPPRPLASTSAST